MLTMLQYLYIYSSESVVPRVRCSYGCCYCCYRDRYTHFTVFSLCLVSCGASRKFEVASNIEWSTNRGSLKLSTVSCMLCDRHAQDVLHISTCPRTTSTFKHSGDDRRCVCSLFLISLFFVVWTWPFVLKTEAQFSLCWIGLFLVISCGDCQLYCIVMRTGTVGGSWDDVGAITRVFCSVDSSSTLGSYNMISFLQSLMCARTYFLTLRKRA